jgi:hypothetical protein
MVEFTKEELENEVWVDIIGYEGLYRISDLGRVMSLAGQKTRKNGVVSSKKEKIVKSHIMKNGYLNVCISKNGTPKSHLIHRIVAEHFIPNPENKKEVNHKNKVRSDARKVNLEWNTRIENVHHSLTLDKTSKYIGVDLCKRDMRWRATIQINNNRTHIGMFSNPYDAMLARTKYEIDMGFDVSNKEGFDIFYANRFIF